VFIDDLKAQINSMMELGDHVIVLVDGNSNMKASSLSKELQAFTLREVFLERHGLEGPSMHKRNSHKHLLTVSGPPQAYE